MNKQLEALERVCDKRYARMLSCGVDDKTASAHVVKYLDGWLERHGKFSEDKREFGQALKDGYLTA